MTIALLLLTAVAGGCSSYRSDPALLATIAHADFGESRSIALAAATDDLRDRAYLLDRQKVLWAALAEGDMDTAQTSADYIYDQLRTQGVNRGKSVGRFAVGDSSVLVWKGEPFEQAAAFAAIAVLDGVNADWGNMRASALGSIFQLRELSEVVERERLRNPQANDLSDRELLVAGVARSERDRPDALFEDSLPLSASDFEPGYALAALAERELGLHAEMQESLQNLEAVNPRLRALAELIRQGAYNTALVVDYGLGPRKVQTGPDGAIAGFQPRTGSSDAPLIVRVNGSSESFPILTDYNRLAADLKWNNFEDVRIAKSNLGTALMVGGGITAVASDDSTAQLIGLGVLLAGAALRSSAGADTRHCEALPQRSYLALVTLPQGRSQVELQVDGRPESRIVLPALPSNGPGDRRLWYVRLPTSSVSWAEPRGVVYSNDASGSVSGAPDLPYVLGGRCVRTPTADLVREYRRAGLPGWVTVDDLERMYDEEGIVFSGAGEIATGRHVLEGGSSMYTPPPGSTGFVRLFCQAHPPYTPTGETAVRILSELQDRAVEENPR